MTTKTEAEVWADLYHPVEHKILADYLQVKPLVPVTGVDIRKPPSQNEYYIHVQKNESGEYGDLSLNNAVARICLELIREGLPQRAEIYPDGRISLGPDTQYETHRPLVEIPRQLFTVDWADFGREVYDVTYLLGYHHYVVTASQGNPDVYGYTEQVIGYFPTGENHVGDQSGEILRAYWRRMDKQQGPWRTYLEGVLIPQFVAETWALDAWDRRTDFNCDLPDWYELRVGLSKPKRPPEDQRRLSRFITLLDAGTPFEELPDDLRT